MSLPELPASVPTLLGPVPVVREAIISDDPRRGECDLSGRIITIIPNVAPEVAWQTLGHEMMHAILWDGAAQHGLTEKQTETVCDAFGTWLAAAVIAGRVVLK
jgi:hypothetical protein